MKRTLIFIFLLLNLNLFGQIKKIGTPNIANYPKTSYGAGTQNWSIVQGEDGLMYFGNNNGVLVFDGINWKTVHISNTAPIRSLNIDDEGQIYLGFYNDFGKLVMDENGAYVFESLAKKITDSKGEIGEIWKIHIMSYGVVFQSFNGVYIYKNNHVDVIYPKDRFHFTFKVNDRLLLQEPGIGLFELTNGVVYKVPWDNFFTGMEIWSILPYNNNQLLIGTKSNGLYKYENGKLQLFDSEINDFLIENNIFCGLKIGSGIFAYGTILNGIVFTNLDGEIIQHINKKKGLSNNTILSAYIDNTNNLWLGLDNGIDYVEINSPISFISDFENIGTGYCAQFFKGDLYLGTNQGLFRETDSKLNCEETPFELVKGTAGQVWSLEVVNDQLLCGHNNGIYNVMLDKAIQISDFPGAWNFVQSKTNPDIVISGHYDGIIVLKDEGRGWKVDQKIKNFNESSRFIYEGEDREFWISHGAKGVLSIQLSENYDSIIHSKWYDDRSGLPSSEQDIVHRINGKIVVSNPDGLFSFNKDSEIFKHDEELNNLLQPSGWLKTVKQDQDRNIWWISEGEIGVLRANEDLSYTRISKPFVGLHDRIVNSFEFIYPFNDKNIYIGIDNGFIHYSSEIQKSYKTNFPVYITSVEIDYLDSVITNPYKIKKEDVLSYPFYRNSFRFNYTAAFFESLDEMVFSYKVQGFIDEWSDWNHDAYKDFTNLHEGEYRFQVKARNIYGVENVSEEFVFEIKPPWYRSLPAYVVYTALFMILVVTVSWYLIRKVERAKQKDKEKHQQEMLKAEEEYKQQALIAEKEIVKLRNDKLRADMIHRDKELANQTMGIIQKNKLFAKILEELDQVYKLIEDSTAKTKINHLKKRIAREADDKKQNQLFETYFDEVHEDFFKRLKEKYPILTPNDLRLCAFIRMNISTKEIASILNISYRGAEISRYRLRKKLDLSRDVNLSSFLSNI